MIQAREVVCTPQSGKSLRSPQKPFPAGRAAVADSHCSEMKVITGLCQELDLDLGGMSPGACRDFCCSRWLWALGSGLESVEEKRQRHMARQLTVNSP